MYGFNVLNLFQQTAQLVWQLRYFLLLFLAIYAVNWFLDFLNKAVGGNQKGAKRGSTRGKKSTSGNKRKSMYDYQGGRLNATQKAQTKAKYEKARAEFVTQLKRDQIWSGHPDFNKRRLAFEVQANRQGLQAWRGKQDFDSMISRLRTSKKSR